MESDSVNKRIQDTLSELSQQMLSNPDILKEAQIPAPETDPEYAIKNYPRLLQLARAGLVPDEMVFKMTNVLKDPKRFGVSPKTRDQLYDLMIKTLNYIVVSDPAAWARFRSFLMNEQSSEIEQRILKTVRAYGQAITKIESQGETKMDKYEQYKDLNEQVNRLLRKEDKENLEEQYKASAEELVEALDDPQKLNTLLKTGLVDSGKVSRIRTALKNPEKAMANTAVRNDLINMLMTLINAVTNNASAFSSVRKGLGKDEEPVTESADEYQAFFNAALKKFGKSGVSEMSDEEKKKFFDYVDKNYKGEKTQDGDISEENNGLMTDLHNRRGPAVVDKSGRVVAVYRTERAARQHAATGRPVKEAPVKEAKEDLTTLRQVTIAKTLRDMK